MTNIGNLLKNLVCRPNYSFKLIINFHQITKIRSPSLTSGENELNVTSDNSNFVLQPIKTHLAVLFYVQYLPDVFHDTLARRKSHQPTS